MSCASISKRTESAPAFTIQFRFTCNAVSAILDTRKATCRKQNSVCREVLSLPMYPELRDETVMQIADSVRQFCRQLRLQVRHRRKFGIPCSRSRQFCSMRIWIDLANSPHVPFFRSLANEFIRRNHEVVVTARALPKQLSLPKPPGSRRK